MDTSTVGLGPNCRHWPRELEAHLGPSTGLGLTIRGFPAAACEAVATVVTLWPLAVLILVEVAATLTMSVVIASNNWASTNRITERKICNEEFGLLQPSNWGAQQPQMRGFLVHSLKTAVIVFRAYKPPS